MRLSHLAVVLGFFFLLLVVPPGGECAESWDKTNPVPEDLYALWGTTDQDIFSVGDSGVILHYNGTTWQESAQQTPLLLDCLWGSSSINVFTAGVNGIIFRYTGTWSLMNTPTINRINALWGSSGTDVFGVGLNGVIIHFDGIDWTVITPSATMGIDLFGLWGSAEDNIYAGGLNGNIFQFNGTTWQKVADASLTIHALWGSSASDIFAVGDSGKILHFTGTTWEALNSGTGLDLYCIWGSSGDDVFAAGQDGIILKYDSGSKTWSEVTTPGISIGGIDIRGIWGSTAGFVYFTGDNGTIVRFQRDDHIPPVVFSTSIMTISSGKAYVTTPVIFHFSEVMDSDTINPTTITLTEKDSTNAITGTVELSSDGLTATFTPNGNLAYSTAYTATATTGVKDAATAKNAMKSNFTLSFTTEDKPKSEGSGGGGCFISSACM